MNVSTKANIFDELHVNLISPKMSKIKNEQKMKPRIQESQISKNDIKPSQTYVLSEINPLNWLKI